MEGKKYVLANGHEEIYFPFIGLTLNQAISSLLDLAEKHNGNSIISIDHNCDDGPYLMEMRLETDEEYEKRMKSKALVEARVEKARQDRIAKLKAELNELEGKGE